MRNPLFKFAVLPFVAFTTLFIGSKASATPAEILIIRHAEKPKEKEATRLSPTGYQRAQALVRVFESGRFHRPEVIIAQSPAKATGSVRCIETVEPLAQALGLRTNTNYLANTGKDMAADVISSPEFDGKVVLISWGNDEIPKIAKKFGALDFPKDWSSHIYDRVWRIVYSNGSAVGEDLPMRALPGDSNH